MKYPKMIMFDYGHTLLCEPDWNSLRGNEELLKYATKNKNNCTAYDVLKMADVIYGEHVESIRKIGYDVSDITASHALYDYLEIEFSLTPLQKEIIFWNAASKGAIMPNADKMLDYINNSGIRSSVISNLLWSGEALKDRFDKLLPNNNFEFIMTSSDYLFRKPNKLLFEIALKKADLNPADVWYCGDSIIADVNGSADAGIFPVWYEDKTTEVGFGANNRGLKPNVEHLHINDWLELILELDKLK